MSTVMERLARILGPAGTPFRFATTEPADVIALDEMGYHVAFLNVERVEEMLWQKPPALMETGTLYVIHYRDRAGVSEEVCRLLGELAHVRIAQLPDGVPTVEALVKARGAHGAKAWMEREKEVAERYGVARAPMKYTEVNERSLASLAERASAPISAVPTFLPLWNAECRGRGGQHGIAHGWHVLIAGVPGMGKTLMANNLADSAINAGEIATFHTLEMEWDDLVLRQMAISCGIPPMHLEPGKWFRQAEYDKAVACWAQQRAERGGALRINYDEMRNLKDLIAGILYNWEVHGSRFHIIDYLQLAWVKGRDKLEQIEEVSHEVRAVGKKHKLVTVGLSQFNRETTKNREESPENEGLMGGSPLENDATQIVLLDHSRVRWEPDGSWNGWALLSKNRHGATIRPPRKPGIPIRFEAKTLRIRERLDDEVSDYETIEGRRGTGRRKG